ncbi:SCP2 sterol-binding domain-containing protein [Thermomonospora umbrina]|uniref:SCP-2 sterol transfer family protein n=1 Tax=Thermomonospora umbrina TaxID=111806 RepID=A0A3D9T0K0_9ACTN|nr:SCP2 sterol-binding domain-containing protein [Thermomonospora umbrina]REE97351.1 SCP-2 sterol transfer family protein [Thermomonospora umbrina]
MSDLSALGDVKALIAASDAAALQELMAQLTAAEIREVLAGLDPADFPALLEKVDPAVLRTLVEGVGTPGELKQFLDMAGDSDPLIHQFIAKAGVDVLLDRVFALMGTRFLPDRVGGENGVVEWHIKTPGEIKVYHVDIADGRAEGHSGPAPGRARTTLTMSAPDLLRLCAGTLNGLPAFMNGKIKLAGDMIFGAKLPGAFDVSG